MKQKMRKVFIPFLLISAFMASTISVNAYEYFGNVLTITSNWDGRDYSGTSVLIIEPNYADGGSDVGCGINVLADDGRKIEDSFIRAEPRLYLDGQLWLAEGWHYSNGTQNGLYAEYFTWFTSRRGKVFAQSVFGLYNGVGYTDHTAPATTTKNLATVTRSMEEMAPIQREFAINENGQTYGSGWIAETPDLIKAIGVGGVSGYVYNADLLSLGDKSSPNDMPSAIPDFIPLYAEDGETVIGKFLIGQFNV